MEPREKYIARLLLEPDKFGFTEAKFIRMPQIELSEAVRIRCQFHCAQGGKCRFSPPLSPEAGKIRLLLEEYKLGVMIRREVEDDSDFAHNWMAFGHNVSLLEKGANKRGYARAFAIGVGNCQYLHHDDSRRPCSYENKIRPTLEAIGVELQETLAAVMMEEHLVREKGQPFNLFGLMLVE